MAYKARTRTLTNRIDTVDGVAIKLVDTAQALSDRSAAGPVNRNELRLLQRQCALAVAEFDAIRGATGIVAKVREEKQEDTTYDVAAEFLAHRNAVESLRAWIHDNFPTDSTSGADLDDSYNSDGTRVPLTFTTAQLATFRTRVAALVATIE